MLQCYLLLTFAPFIWAMAPSENLLLGSLPNLQNMANMQPMGMSNMGGLSSFNQLPAFGDLLGEAPPEPQERIPCSCGIFLNGQFRRGSPEPPKGNPALLQELTEPFACSAMGEKQCMNKCLETIMRHLPNSPLMVCGSIDRDCHKERAYLFVKNCKDKWINTNLSAGREYCCKDGMPYKCPPS